MGISNYRMRLLSATTLSLGLFFIIIVGTVSAHVAHAVVMRADPGIGSTIATLPTKVTVFTAENMKPGPQLSNLFVYGPSGALISQGDAKVDLNNPQQMSVAIKPEKDGVYIVRWITVSADDNDPDQGAFVFTVHASATVIAPVKHTSLLPIPPIWFAGIGIIIAFLVLVGALVVSIRRRRTLRSATRKLL